MLTTGPSPPPPAPIYTDLLLSCYLCSSIGNTAIARWILPHLTENDMPKVCPYLWLCKCINVYKNTQKLRNMSSIYEMCKNITHIWSYEENIVRGLNLQKHRDCSHRSTSTNFGPGLDMTIIYQFLEGAKMGSLCGSHFGQIQDGRHPE